MDHSYRNLAVEAAFWLVSIVGCAGALILSRRAPPKWLGLSLVLALFALTVGYLGLWTPFSFVPRIGYGWASGDYSLQIDLNRFFIVPLVLGSLALLLAVRAYWKSRRATKAAEQAET